MILELSLDLQPAGDIVTINIRDDETNKAVDGTLMAALSPREQRSDSDDGVSAKTAASNVI